MPSVFAITPDDEKVKCRLDAQGRGQFGFTVTNTYGKPITARARVTPRDPSQQSWYSIQDDPQRDYPGIKGVEKFTVAIAAPKNAAPGNYCFHFDVISRDEPDELFTIGPSVSFEVPQPEKKQPLKLFPILAVVAAVLVIGVALWYFFRAKTVPSLVGLTQAAADTQAQSANLKIGTITLQRTGTQAAGSVVSQTPSAGSPLPANATLSLVLEQSPFATVPNLVGMDIAKAQDALTAANLTLGRITNLVNYAGTANTVLGQSLLANSQVATLTSINLSVKANTVQVPLVVGQPIATAIATINNAHLVASPVLQSYAGPILTVVTQDPSDSTIVAQQTVVSLYYSTTPAAPLSGAIPASQFNALPAATKAKIQMTPAPTVKTSISGAKVLAK